MSAALAKAPTLAWLLTALACLLTGMAIVESRSQAVVVPAQMVTDVNTPEVATASTAVIVEPAAPNLIVENVPLPITMGRTSLRVERLTVPPGTSLLLTPTPGPAPFWSAPSTAARASPTGQPIP